jgi:hypothetical protein
MVVIPIRFRIVAGVTTVCRCISISECRGKMSRRQDMRAGNTVISEAPRGIRLRFPGGRLYCSAMFADTTARKRLKRVRPAGGVVSLES